MQNGSSNNNSNNNSSSPNSNKIQKEVAFITPIAPNNSHNLVNQLNYNQKQNQLQIANESQYVQQQQQQMMKQKLGNQKTPIQKPVVHKSPVKENNENILNEELLNEILLPDTRIFASLLNKDNSKLHNNEGTNKLSVKMF